MLGGWQSATQPVATLPAGCGTLPVAILSVGCGTLPVGCGGVVVLSECVLDQSLQDVGSRKNLLDYFSIRLSTVLYPR